MKGHKQVHRDQQGSIILVVLGFLFLTIGLVLTIMSVGSNARKVAQEQLNMEQAMFVAEGGLERGARFMESNLVVIVNSGTGITNGTGTINSGTYTFYIARSNGASSTYMLVSTGTVNSTVGAGTVTRVCSLLNVYQPTYAQFALWSHLNGGLYFGSGENYHGHVHADDELYFTGSPSFYAQLTSNFGTYGGSISSVYMQYGLALNSYQGTMADVNFNSGSSSLKSIATSSGVAVSGNTTLTFSGSTVQITNPTKGWVNHSYSIPASGGMIYVANNGSTTGSKAGTIYLQGGTVTGPLTVVSENDMYVENNITYTHDPVSNPTTTDALGLISQDDIWIDTGAPRSLTIDAAMIAAGTSGDGSDGSFGALNYNTRSAGTLTLYGGIVQEQRGAVCMFNGSGVVINGYAKNYSYDQRFLTKPPPNYPTISNAVSFSQWTEGH
jgi:hypothetical protein